MLSAPKLSRRCAKITQSEIRAMSLACDKAAGVNLAQGVCDTPVPPEVIAGAKRGLDEGINSYTRYDGIAAIRRAIAGKMKSLYGIDVDPETEVVASAGSTGAFYAACLALLDPGDEVLLFEPFYGYHVNTLEAVEVVPKFVSLRAPDWSFDPDELRAAIGPRTKGIMINTPANPSGKVFTRAELELIEEVARERDLIVVTDEVYEHLTFDGVEHISLATLPGMRERTLVISSGGKTFNTTGWKIGWICAPADLLVAARTAKQFLTYVNGGPFQAGIAVGLGLGDDFYVDLAADLQSKRDRLLPGLVEAGFDVYPTSGTYFVTVDVRPLRADGDGMAFCRELAHRCGVVAIPNEVFYANKHEGRHLVRFAFSKRLDVIDEAVARLKTLAA